jgi:nitrile hydratase accessory protein
MTDPSVSEALLPRADEGAVFDEPWQAQAFALAVRLAETGCFTWNEWTTALAEEIRAARERGDADLGHTYYQHWLNALERLCTRKKFVAVSEMQVRKEEWRRAYVNTPHGQAVELAVGQRQGAFENKFA